MLGLVASVPSSAQQLSLPSDPLAGRVIESTAMPVESTAGSPLTVAPMSPDASMIGQGPISASAAGSYYNPLLGSHIRARYNTQSYGQQAGTLDLGTMKLMPLDGGMAFLDGQVTLNDESHVGYNLGVGYRWMTLPLFPFSPDDRKIMGVSVWSDGGSKGGSNFFPQIGTSLEFLGDRIDFRANGYAPIGDRTQTRDFVPTTTEGFTGNGIGLLLQGIEDTALTVGEAEVAGRLGDLDAWAFAGVYGMRGGIYDAVGGKVGLRGYVTPDLFLSVGVANDDEFDTNALVNLTWFIGRTRAENCPTGVLEDRLREPVLRNNYVASQERFVTRVGDVARAVDGSALRIVHVDSTAGPTGDGTFENPFNSLDDIEAGTLANDTILFHGGSDFNNQQAVLLDGQIALGEGGNFVTTVNTFELGVTNLPETAPGAQAGARPTIDGGTGAGIVLADGNTIENLDFDGGVNAIVNDPNGSNGATLRNLSIANTTGDGISLAAVIGVDTDGIDNDGQTDDAINLLGNIAISDVQFDGVGGNDIDIDADVGTLNTDDIFAETITISDVTSDNNTSEESIAIRNTTANGTAFVTDFTYNGGATGQGGLLIDQTAGAVAFTNSTLNGGATTAATFTQATGNINVNDITYNGGTTSTGGLLFDRTTGTVVVDQPTSTLDNTGSTFNGGTGVAITASGDNGTSGTVTINDMVYNGGTTSTGGVLFTQTTGTMTVNDSTFNDGTGVAVTADRTAGATNINTLVYDGGTTGTGGVSVDTATGPVNIDGATFTAGVGVGIAASNSQSDITIDNVTYEGGTTATGALSLTQTTGNVTVENSDFNEGIGPAVNVDRTTGPVSIGATVDITNVNGKSVVINQPGGSVPNGVTVGATISNDATVDGGGVVIESNESIVSFTGNITTQNDQSVRINDSQANITFSGDIVDNGTGDAITIVDAGTNTANTAEVSFTGDLTNDNGTGRSVFINNGDDDILLSGNLTDDGDGVVISNRDAGSEVTFGTPGTNMTINSGANNGITLSGNDATSIVTVLADLDITTTSGTGISSTNGQLDFSNAGNSVTTETGRALDIDAGSSITGVRFGSVEAGTMGAVAGEAIRLDTFDGTVTINDGQLNSVGNAVFLNNASLTMSSVDINSGTNIVTAATFSNALNHTLSLSDFDATGASVSVVSSGAGNGTLTLSEVTGLDDDVIFNDTNAGNGTLAVTNVESTAGVNFDSTGDGTASMTVSGGSFGGNIDALASNNDTFTANVIGNTELTTSDIRIDAQNTGTFSTTVAGVTDGSGGPIDELDIDANANVTDATVVVTGGEYASIDIDSVNTGMLDVSVNGAESNALLEITNDTTTTDTTVSISGGSHNGVTFNSANTGTLDVDVNNVDVNGVVTISSPNTAGATTVDVIDGSNTGVVITAQNNGTLATRVNNVDTTTGTVVINANANVENASYEITGGENTGVTLASANTGTFDATFGNVVSTGVLDLDATNVGNSTIAFNGSQFEGLDINAANNGQISFSMQNVTSNTAGGALTAATLAFGSGITNGDVDIFGANAFTAADARALDISFGGGAIDFRVANGAFENASGTFSTANIEVSGSGVLGSTIDTNTFTNTNPGGPVEFALSTTAGAPTVNLNIVSNTAVAGGGNGEFSITENVGDINVFELTDTFDNNRNTGTFAPDNRVDFDDLGSEPALPNP